MKFKVCNKAKTLDAVSIRLRRNMTSIDYIGIPVVQYTVSRHTDIGFNKLGSSPHVCNTSSTFGFIGCKDPYMVVESIQEYDLS